MAAYRSSSTNSVQSTSISLNVPSGVQNGDLLIFQIIVRGNATASSTPEGWTFLVERFIDNGDGPDAFVYYKIANNESGSYTFTITATLRMAASITAWSEVDSITPIESYSDTVYTTYNTTIRYGSVTTTEPNQTVVLLGNLSFNPPPTFTPPTDFTEHVDYSNDLRTSVGVFSKVYASSGNTGDIDGTVSATTEGKHGFALVLKNVSAGSASLPPSITGIRRFSHLLTR